MAEPPAPPARDLPVTELLRQGDMLCSLAVEPSSSHDRRRLGGTALASRPDVDILAIRRDEGLIIDPSKEEELRDGDVLIYLEGCGPRPPSGGGGEARPE